MLPKKYRLKNKKAFDATYKNRNIISDSMLTIYLGKEKKESQTAYQSKIGFVVSKKYHKRATKRNRIKRLMREVFRLALKNETKLSKISKHMSFIMLPKITALGTDFKTVEASFNKLLERIK